MTDDALLAAGDALAHELEYQRSAPFLDAWWRARGGHDKCTVCHPPAPREWVIVEYRDCAKNVYSMAQWMCNIDLRERAAMHGQIPVVGREVK